MKKNDNNFFVGLLYGTGLSIPLWVTFIAVVKGISEAVS
ncbi:hypothetical protein SAMN05421503_2745 [Terribacillus aidingensis]|uniref:Uncharacterized protein n=1 Tax=Terribacillus aidingensis TaxID=586416 RepID=A0A285P2V5_9BACI|nr:hypothetical protein SAMN05421503_2745 [Terribacillus aidingensis]